MIAMPAGPRGRPKKGEERPTVLTRMFADQVEMLAWISRIEQRTVAAILDDLLGDRLDEAFAAIREHAQAIKAAEDAARSARGVEPTPPLPA